ncbi:protein MAIN-LIKE 1-like [Gossypium raimondii]|uniref:protein MAIN-LIKE 1-like n=1 Tax=Gossypium raimondii TaxID=29730 RepID=UPI00227BDA6E|nr:protein MAIN-LIKE 1-like [Gossypium raimondii]
MCRRPNQESKNRRLLSSLQSWARFRFPFLRPRVNHPYTFPLVTRWNHPASYYGLPSELEDIRILLEQWSEAEFQWTPYEDPAVRAVIPEEFLQNPNAWHVKVVLINYATVEPHQTDRVLRQFRCRQPIPADPEVFNEHHKIDLRLLATDWTRYWSEYIEMWENRYEYMYNTLNAFMTQKMDIPH